MKSITIHNIEPELQKGIQKEAEKYGLSLDKTVKKLLRKSIGLKLQKRVTKEAELREIFGVWTKEDAEEFERNVADSERIDEDDWK